MEDLTPLVYGRSVQVDKYPSRTSQGVFRFWEDGQVIVNKVRDGVPVFGRHCDTESHHDSLAVDLEFGEQGSSLRALALLHQDRSSSLGHISVPRETSKRLAGGVYSLFTLVP